MAEDVKRKPAPPPPGLEKAGRQLWNRIAGVYSLRADELMVLENACQTRDLIVRLQEELSKVDSLEAEGSMGQRIVNPLATEVRMQRTTLNTSLKQLALPDLDEDDTALTETPKSARHQAAAQARWGRRKDNLTLAGTNG